MAGALTLLVGALSPSSSAYVFSLPAPAPVLNSSAFGAPPAFIALSSSGARAYVANEAREGALTSVALARDAAGAWHATRVGAVACDEPAHVALHASGRWVLTASYARGTVSAFHVDAATGAAGPAVAVLAPAGAAAKAHEVVFSGARADTLYVPLLGADAVATLRLDVATGALSTVALLALPSGAGPRHLALHPTLPARAYVICELTNEIFALTVDAASGALALAPGEAPFPTARTAGRAAPETQAAADVLVAPDGRFLYATNRARPRGAGDNSVVVVPLGADGRMNASGAAWADGGAAAGAVDFPRHAALVRGGALLAVANQGSGVVGVWARDAESGGLTLVDAVGAGADAGGGLGKVSWVGELGNATTA